MWVRKMISPAAIPPSHPSAPTAARDRVSPTHPTSRPKPMPMTVKSNPCMVPSASCSQHGMMREHFHDKEHGRGFLTPEVLCCPGWSMVRIRRHGVTRGTGGVPHGRFPGALWAGRVAGASGSCRDRLLTGGSGRWRPPVRGGTGRLDRHGFQPHPGPCCLGSRNGHPSTRTISHGILGSFGRRWGRGPGSCAPSAPDGRAATVQQEGPQ